MIPTEVVDDKSQTMEPYYIIMKLPGEEEAEYILMLPFTPKEQALIWWGGCVPVWMEITMENYWYIISPNRKLSMIRNR